MKSLSANRVHAGFLYSFALGLVLFANAHTGTRRVVSMWKTPVSLRLSFPLFVSVIDEFSSALNRQQYVLPLKNAFARTIVRAFRFTFFFLPERLS